MQKVALITGGTRGIGLGIARCLANDGYGLMLNGRRPQSDVQAVLDELVEAGAYKVGYGAADLSDKSDRIRLLDETRNTFGRLDVLVNNAGIAPRVRGPILEASEESFEEVIRVNLQGPYFLTQLAARWMVEQKKEGDISEPCIVNVTSISSTLASSERGEYCISKAGLSMATQLWAVGLAPYGIPVFEVRPGVIRTDMTAGVGDKYDKLIAGGLTLQPRWGLPEDVGKAVAVLANGQLPYSTGQVIMVDGGLTVDRL